MCNEVTQIFNKVINSEPNLTVQMLLLFSMEQHLVPVPPLCGDSSVGTARAVGTLVPIDLGSGLTADLGCGQLLLTSALHHWVFIF